MCDSLVEDDLTELDHHLLTPGYEYWFNMHAMAQNVCEFGVFNPVLFNFIPGPIYIFLQKRQAMINFLSWESCSSFQPVLHTQDIFPSSVDGHFCNTYVIIIFIFQYSESSLEFVLKILSIKILNVVKFVYLIFLWKSIHIQ